MNRMCRRITDRRTASERMADQNRIFNPVQADKLFQECSIADKDAKEMKTGDATGSSDDNEGGQEVPDFF